MYSHERRKMLYQYTDVESLALILSNKTIRFRALNLLDDLQEQETMDLKNLGQYVFVSCWTEDSDEKIPMWKMYTGMESGVRIGLPEYPFKERENNPADLKCIFGENVNDNTGGVYIKVEYTRDKEKLYPKIYNKKEDSTTIDLGKLGKHKNEGWAFQKEWRYIIQFYPLDISNIESSYESIQTMVNNMINGKNTLSFSHYDVPINESAFLQMEIVLSPKISLGNKLIVEDLVEKYNKYTIIRNSIYTDLLA